MYSKYLYFHLHGCDHADSSIYDLVPPSELESFFCDSNGALAVPFLNSFQLLQFLLNYTLSKVGTEIGITVTAQIKRPLSVSSVDLSRYCFWRSCEEL